MHRPFRRRLPLALAGLSLAGLALTGLAACSLDEAELVGTDAGQVTAEPGQLRVLTYDDGPDDRWIDIVEPDPEVFTEGDEFREENSRAAAPDEPAERRRLMTAVDAGRTLLVELNCPTCDGELPASDAAVTGIHVWDLAVGDHDQAFSDDTPVATGGGPQALAVGQPLVVVLPDDTTDPVARVLPDGLAPLRLVASYAPTDGGADLFVDVYVATEAGDAVLTYDAGGSTVTYEVRVA